MFKAINPLNQVYVHTGGESAMNWCGFFDVMVEGEQFTAAYLAEIVHTPALPKNYTKLINLDRYRANSSPMPGGRSGIIFGSSAIGRCRSPMKRAERGGHLRA